MGAPTLVLLSLGTSHQNKPSRRATVLPLPWILPWLISWIIILKHKGWQQFTSLQTNKTGSTFAPQSLGQNPHRAHPRAEGSGVSSGDRHEPARCPISRGLHPGLALARTAPALSHLLVGARGEIVSIEAAAATPDFFCSARGGGRQQRGCLSLVENTLPGTSSSHFFPSPPT